ncbi:hypothetical protein DYB32_003607 [Aphanomyces invadans]|uniref:Protein kinase domain-containing protein n=1 Tax=Aphanomyces invadans TaxID=157072 RepID=A0A3R7AAZ3_9STRA|nr:hypothetical protein DYB32_003607 [Aphanomyces invadans]
MFVLQPETPTPPAIVPPSPKVEVAMSPTAKFLFGDELRMKKAMLKHVETSREEETKALLVQIEATVRSSTRVHLWPSHDFRGGVPVGEGIHACVKQIQVDGHAVALKEFRYEAQGRSVPPHGVVTTFRHELDVLMAIDHNNIVKLVGVVLEPRLAIVTEYMDGGRYSYPSDIWSFGVFLWELVTPSAYPNPFVGVSSDAFVDKVTCGTRPTLEFAGECAPILEECWRLIPSERPTADALVAELTALLHAN